MPLVLRVHVICSLYLPFALVDFYLVFPIGGRDLFVNASSGIVMLLE